MDPVIFAKGAEYLANKDPVIGRLIQAYGNCNRPTVDDPFAALCRSIVAQQLSTRAAEAIWERFIQYFGAIPSPKDVLNAKPSELRSLGLSTQKIRYLRDLAGKAVEKTVLDLSKLGSMDDEVVVKTLVQVKGIGVWTAQMFLIFGLGRPDVWAVDDLGLRKAVQNLFELPVLPDTDQIVEKGERWRPYRTVASLYLWKSLNNQPVT